MRHALRPWLLAIALVGLPTASLGTPPDPELRRFIDGIRAIDNHAHALPARKPDASEADRPDPLGRSMFPYPVRLRPDHPEYRDAWRALYGYEHDDMAPEHARDALREKLRLMDSLGTDYPNWVLDKAGIEVMLVNMPVLGPGQSAPRFHWVAQADGLLFPFPDRRAAPDVDPASTAAAPPETLDAYLTTRVRPAIEKLARDGAVAIKFGIAYNRPLDFADVPIAEARLAYERGLSPNEPKATATEVKALQDFLFREIAREAGKNDLAVHIHTGVGADVRFNIRGSDPLLLESVLNDRSLEGTKFVIVHGGWPFERAAGVMLLKPNVYADFSAQTFLRSTQALSETLEEWLDFYPERVLFGTDAYPEDTPLANWEEKAWLTTRSSRDALALALSRMMADGRITRARAEALATMVLRENAMALYGFEAR